MSTILIVEDDKTIALGIEYSLLQEGFQVDVAHTVASAEDYLKQTVYHLILLDVALPDGTGFDLCQNIRKQFEIPIIFLTARDEEVHVVMGLDLGADDYVTKPFRVRELLSRIKSVLRRAKGYHSHSNSHSTIRFGDLAIYSTEAKVTKQNEEVTLTPLEYKLLLTFARHPGQILTRDQLLENIWDIAGDFVNDNTLTVYIKRLREKIEDNPQQPQHIQTVRGLGYKAGDRP